MKKFQRHISLSAEVDEHIRKNHEGNFSQMCENWYRDSFMNLDKIRSKIKEQKKELRKLEAEFKLYQKMKNTKDKSQAKVTYHELQWWQQTDKILKKDFGYLDGRISSYNNEFAKKISPTQFIQKLELFRKNKLKAVKK